MPQAPSVVSVALGMAGTRLGGLAGKTAVVVGAGAMGALSAAQLARAGVRRHPRRQPVAAPRRSGWPEESANRASEPKRSASTGCPPRWPTPTWW